MKEYMIGEVFRHTDGKSISAWKMSTVKGVRLNSIVIAVVRIAARSPEQTAAR